MDDTCGISTTYSRINFDHGMVGLLSLECGIPQLHYATPAAVYSGFSALAVFPDRRFFPDRPEPWRGRRLGTAEAVPHERLEPRPGRRSLVPVGRVATNHWSVASALREGTLGRKAPRPLRSHAGCGPMSARAPRPRAGEDSYCQTVRLGILYTTMPLHRAMLSRHGYAAKPARSNV